MPRTALTPINLPGPWAMVGTPLTWTATDPVNGNRFAASGRDLILARNVGAGAGTLTVLSFPIPRLGAIQETLAAGGGYDAVVIADTPIHYWKLNESSLGGGQPIADAVGGRNGTVAGSGLSADAAPGKGASGAIFFNGSAGGSRIDLGTAALLGGRSALSVEAWVRVTSLPHKRGFIGTGTNAAPGPWSGRVLTSPNRINFEFNGALGIDNPSTIALDTWYHVVCTLAASTLRLYVNGVEVASGSGPASINADAGVAKHIGHDVQDQFAWNGTLSRVAIYDRAISLAEVQDHYTAMWVDAFTQRVYGPLPSKGWEQADGYIWLDSTSGDLQVAVARIAY